MTYVSTAQPSRTKRPSQLILFGTIAGHWVWQLCRHILPQLSHNFHDDDVELNVLGCQVDIFGTNCDQCVSMVQCCFTSTETVRLIRTESPGRPPQLSHSSWMLSIAFCSNTAFKAPSISAVGSHYLLSPQMLKSILRTICRTICLGYKKLKQGGGEWEERWAWSCRGRSIHGGWGWGVGGLQNCRLGC